VRKRKIHPPKVEMDFTDLNLTAYGGSSILAETARRYGLFELLADAVRVKVRNRRATDAETPTTRGTWSGSARRTAGTTRFA